MQLIILIYHMTGASQIISLYMQIRVLVSSYLFLTAYGHFCFFWNGANTSFVRLCQVFTPFIHQYNMKFLLRILTINICMRIHIFKIFDFDSYESKINRANNVNGCIVKYALLISLFYVAFAGIIPHEFHDGGYLPMYEPSIPVVLLRAIGIILVCSSLRCFNVAS